MHTHGNLGNEREYPGGTHREIVLNFRHYPKVLQLNELNLTQEPRVGTIVGGRELEVLCWVNS